MQALAKLFAMTPRTWERHANPLSVWTRVPVLPLLCVAICLRVWLGWWCLIPVGLLLAWIWVNPRAFPPPETTRSWASRAVMGERVWLNRAAVPIPRHHESWALLLSVLSGAGLLPLVWGLVMLDVYWILFGLVVTMVAKMWFLDRMVWLYEDMSDMHPEYRVWLR